MTCGTETVQYTIFSVQKYSREGIADKQTQILGRDDEELRNTHKSMGWEHLSLQPLTCRIGVHHIDTDTPTTMLSIEWIPPNAASIVLVRTFCITYLQESLCLQGACPGNASSDVQITYHDTRIGVRCKGERGAGPHRPARRFQLQLHHLHDTRALISLIEHKCTCVPAQIVTHTNKTLTPPSTPAPMGRDVHTSILTPPIRQSARSTRTIWERTHDD